MEELWVDHITERHMKGGGVHDIQMKEFYRIRGSGLSPPIYDS